MRLIDADAMKESIDSSDTDEMKILSTKQLHELLVEWIDARVAIDAIDAVEVVRCEDCRKRGGEDCPMYHWQDISIYQGDDIWDEDHEITDNTEDGGFCHCGERRSDD